MDRASDSDLTWLRQAIVLSEVFARASRPVAVRGPLIEDEARAAHAGYWA
jgi:hypothetical protein